jgi:outer membrane protein
VVLIASIVATTSGVPSPGHAETLSEAIAKVYRTNPEIAAAEANLEALSELPIQARAEGRPTADAGVSSGYDDTGLGTNGATDVSARWQIWSGGRVSAASAAAEADVAAGKQDLRNIEANVVERVVNAYANLLLAQETVEVARQGIERLDKQVEEARLRFNLGRATLTDVAQLQAQLGSVRENLAIAENDFAVATAAYLAVVGEEPDELSEQIPSPIGLAQSRESARELALKDNPVLLRERRNVDAALFRVREARAGRAPTIELGGSFAQAGQLRAGQFNNFTTDASVTIGIRIPILTGGLVPSQVRASQATFRAEQFTVEAVEREVVRITDVAWADLAAAQGRLKANEYRAEAAELALQGILLEYNLGLRSTIDILVADDALRAAQVALASSRADILIAQAGLLRATGNLERQAYN